MDPIVKLAMAKWPNVPHCYAWLALDARGDWRMRDERAQALNLAGEKIIHSALLAFIARNYAVDERGCWYFQNGPQRVYVNLASTPYILHTDQNGLLFDQTGKAWQTLDTIWLASEGQCIVQSEGKVGQLDDRDLAQCLANFQLNQQSLSDEKWQAWLAGEALVLHFLYAGQSLPVRRLASAAPADLAQQFGFCRVPQANADNLLGS